MMKIRATARQTTATATVPALLAALVMLSGCAREERGPTLSGGREVKSWIKDLHDPKPQVRRQAVLKLGNAGDADPSVAEGLAEALNDSDVLVRRDAIRAISKLEHPGAAIRSRLETMSRSDKDYEARELARKSLDRPSGFE